MSKTLLTRGAIGTAAAAVLLAGVVGWSDKAAAQGHTIKIVFLANTEDEDYDGSLVFQDFVVSRSNGAIAVEIFPGGQLCGNPAECIDALQAGVIEVFITTIGGLSNVFPESQVLDLPYMFRDDRVAECALAYGSPFFDELRSAVLDRPAICG